jgi:hypothetical protein
MKTGLFLFVAFLAGCSSDPSTGTGSQTGNSIVAGRIAASDSMPAGTTVYLRPLNWTPSQAVDSNYLRTTTTDSNGDYVFRDVPVDTYRIEARRRTKGWSKTVSTMPAMVTTAPLGTLVTVGRLVGEIELNDSLKGAVVELYGLDRSFTIPANGICPLPPDEPGESNECTFAFDSLPVGLQTVRIWSTKTNSVICDLPVRIGADSVSKVEYEQWGREVHGPREDD